jgi:hypothetical protein
MRRFAITLCWLIGGMSVGSPLAAQLQETLDRPAFARGTGPQILYDTAHWNPPLTEGRYQAVADLLRGDGYRINPGAVPFRLEELSRYRLLFVVLPFSADRSAGRAARGTPVFSEEECDVLAAWVRDGGSLLLVVSHAPSGAATANLARRFGVDVRNSTTLDPTRASRGGDPSCLGCLKFTLENQLLRPHPITLGRDTTERVLSVISANGTSLGVSDDQHILLALGPAAYDVRGTDTLPAHGRAQAIALPHGAGRVAIVGNGSMLAGFAYAPERSDFRLWWPTDPDNRQFTLNLVRWLTGLLPAHVDALPRPR